MDPDPGNPKTYGSGSATLPCCILYWERPTPPFLCWSVSAYPRYYCSFKDASTNGSWHAFVYPLDDRGGRSYGFGRDDRGGRDDRYGGDRDRWVSSFTHLNTVLEGWVSLAPVGTLRDCQAIVVVHTAFLFSSSLLILLSIRYFPLVFIEFSSHF